MSCTPPCTQVDDCQTRCRTEQQGFLTSAFSSALACLARLAWSCPSPCCSLRLRSCARRRTILVFGAWTPTPPKPAAGIQCDYSHLLLALLLLFLANLQQFGCFQLCLCDILLVASHFFHILPHLVPHRFKLRQTVHGGQSTKKLRPAVIRALLHNLILWMSIWYTSTAWLSNCFPL